MDVVTAKKTVDVVVETLSKCRNEESFNLLWSRALIMAEEIKKGIDVTEFTFREAEVPRKELIRPSRRPQALVSETHKANDEVQNRISEDHYRVTCYYTSIDKVVAEIRSRFDGHDQEVLSGLADIVFNHSPANASQNWYLNFMTLTVISFVARRPFSRKSMPITLMPRQKCRCNCEENV